MVGRRAGKVAIRTDMYMKNWDSNCGPGPNCVSLAEENLNCIYNVLLNRPSS